MFPARDAGGRMLSAAGAIWVRRIEGRWLVCHVCIPEWSSIRSTPSWSIVIVSDEDFRRHPVLSAAVLDVRGGARAPERWANDSPSWVTEPWDARAVAKLAALVDRALRASPSELGTRVTHPEAWLDHAGWLALQQMLALQQLLAAMPEFDAKPPVALVVSEAAWEPPAGAIPDQGIYEFRSDVVPVGEPLGQPVARGVEVGSFIGSFAECSTLMVRIAECHRAQENRPESFAEALAPCVPLGAIDPSRLHRHEWAGWAAEVAQASATIDVLHQRIEGLVRRFERGEHELLAPLLRLLAAAADAASVDRAEPGMVDGERWVADWVARLVRA